MCAAYRAILRGDRLEWTGDRPAHPEDGIAVEVTVLAPAEMVANGSAIASSLDAMARAGVFADVADPVAWQRAVRADRPLPRRDA